MFPLASKTSFTEWCGKHLQAPTLISLPCCAILACSKLELKIRPLKFRWIPELQSTNFLLLVINNNKRRSRPFITIASYKAHHKSLIVHVAALHTIIVKWFFKNPVKIQNKQWQITLVFFFILLFFIFLLVTNQGQEWGLAKQDCWCVLESKLYSACLA